MTAIPSDQRSRVTPVAPAITAPVARARSMAAKVSRWIRESASMNTSTSPRAARAPPLRTAAMTRGRTVTTWQPAARASSAVWSVEPLSATITSIRSGPPG